MRPELQKKVNFAIMLIQESSKVNNNEPIEVAYSGGKDSDVILELTKMAGIPYRAIYKNTTIDPPGTIKHAQDMGAEIVRPKKTFFQLIQQNGLPSRYYRFCCSELKEYQFDKSIHKVIMGIRSDESSKRKKNYTEPSKCIGTKKNPYEGIFPILSWSNQDVEEFIAERGIKCHPLYYDENGNFHVERRLGCIGCPLEGRIQREREYKEYPKLLKQTLRNARIYRQNNSTCNATALFANEYEWFYKNMYCDTYDEFTNRAGGIFDKPDFKKYLEDKFNIKL